MKIASYILKLILPYVKASHLKNYTEKRKSKYSKTKPHSKTLKTTKLPPPPPSLPLSFVPNPNEKMKKKKRNVNEKEPEEDIKKEKKKRKRNRD